MIFNTTIVAATVVAIINTNANTTRYSTIFNKLPSGYELPETNAAGTHTAKVSYTRGGKPQVLDLAFPTAFTAWDDNYSWTGALPTSTFGHAMCLNASDTSVVPFPSYPQRTPTRIPTNTELDFVDSAGLFFSTIRRVYYMDAYKSHYSDVAAMQKCTLRSDVAPAMAVMTAKFLTKTSTRLEGGPGPSPSAAPVPGLGPTQNSNPNPSPNPGPSPNLEQQQQQQNPTQGPNNLAPAPIQEQPQKPTQSPNNPAPEPTQGQPQDPTQGPNNLVSAQSQGQPQNPPASSPGNQPNPQSGPTASAPISAPNNPNPSPNQAPNGPAPTVPEPALSGQNYNPPPTSVYTAITADGHVVTANSQGNYIINGQTAIPNSKGNVVVGTQTYVPGAITAAAAPGLLNPVVTIGTQIVTANSQGNYVVNGVTVTPNGQGNVVVGTQSYTPGIPTGSFGGVQTTVMINGQVVTANSQGAFVVSGVTASTNPQGNVVVGTQTFTTGATSVDGGSATTTSAGIGGAIVSIGGFGSSTANSSTSGTSAPQAGSGERVIVVGKYWTLVVMIGWGVWLIW